MSSRGRDFVLLTSLLRRLLESAAHRKILSKRMGARLVGLILLGLSFLTNSKTEIGITCREGPGVEGKCGR